MKWAIGFLAFFWAGCGLLGANWLGNHHWQTIARGPMSLAKAYNDNPISYPGPN